MQTVNLQHPADVEGWRVHARKLLAKNVPPEAIVWQANGESDDLFSQMDVTAVNVPLANATSTVPREFINLAQYAGCHTADDRFALLYRVLWRITHGEHDLLKRTTDDDVHRLNNLRRNVSRDRHKMTAFVRFRRQDNDHYIAWFEPTHHILRLTSTFFKKRFYNMRWSIYTPEASAHWDGESMVFAEGGRQDDLPQGEVMEDLWRTYFGSIFNPARLRIKAMQSEMPVKYWKNLPEAPLIASLIHESGNRTQEMIDLPGTDAPRFAAKAQHPVKHGINTTDNIAELKPATSLEELKHQAKGCQRCAHAQSATHMVFGVTSSTRSLPVGGIMLVGEQPGDQEDLKGEAFVGPAGQLLRTILSEINTDQQSVYITNAVKHFKYSIRGKRRLHQRPSESDIANCQHWLHEEIRLIQPNVIVALGATAAKSILGRDVKINAVRGKWQTLANGCRLLITTHPAFVLRTEDVKAKAIARQHLCDDLALAFDDFTPPQQPDRHASKPLQF